MAVEVDGTGASKAALAAADAAKKVEKKSEKDAEGSICILEMQEREAEGSDVSVLIPVIDGFSTTEKAKAWIKENGVVDSVYTTARMSGRTFKRKVTQISDVEEM